MTDTRSEAHRLHRAKLPITLCPPSSKKPLGQGWDAEQNGRSWQKMRWTHAEIDRAFKVRGQLNVGLLLGPQSGLIDIEDDSDGDRPALVQLFAGEPPPVTPMFKSPRGSHRLFAWDDMFEQIGKAVADFHGLENRVGAGGKGAQSLVPPSVTDGVAREWVVPLDECKPARLPDSVVQRIIECNALTTASGRPRVALHRVHREPKQESVSSVYPREVDGDTEQLVRAAIRVTTPTSQGHRHRCIFNFARHLKAIPSLMDAAAEQLRPSVEQWHRTALPNLTTKAFEETWYDFRNAWERVRWPAGVGLVDDLFARAISQAPPICADIYEGSTVRTLVALCRELQRQAGEASFFLACRTAGRLLGVSHTIASRWLGMLCKDKILVLVEKGCIHRANEYRYLCDL
jgi:hypothetical protein